MSDLFKKLNVLVKASINDILGDDLAIGAPQRKLDPAKLGKNIDREIATLRQRINEALAYEDELQARVQKLSIEVANLDQQADEAVAQGRDADARHTVEQMQYAQQRLTMAQSDLDAHQLVTQELIQRVNTLEAAVADARRRQAESEPERNSAAAEIPTDSTGGLAGRLLSDVLHEAQEKIAAMGDLISARQEMSSSSPETNTTNDEAIKDDLAQRRERLSKPK
jgi:phage shock protein A